MLGLIRRWRDARESRRLARYAIPQPLWAQMLADHAWIARRPAADLAALRRLCSLFLAEKEFHGAQGFVVTDAVAVAIAAQACLPVLRLGLGVYRGFVGIVVHPGEVVASREVMDDTGIVHTYDEVLAGEAVEGGPLMLAWSEVRHGATGMADAAEAGAYNVVIHELMHVLDAADGLGVDGAPPLPSPAARSAWLEKLTVAWDGWATRIAHGEPSVIDAYGTHSLDEFFAVSVEAYFVEPEAFAAQEPALYALYKGYFQDART